MLKAFYLRSYMEFTYLHTLGEDLVKEGFRDKAFQTVTNILLREPNFSCCRQYRSVISVPL